MTEHMSLEDIKRQRVLTDQKSLFEDALRPYSDANNIDPTRLNAVVKSYSDKFETFRGVFLEQESKEQFLKLILEQDTTVVTQQKIADVKERNLNLQQELGQRGLAAEKLTHTTETKAKAHQNLENEIEEKLKVIETLHGDISTIRAQIQQIKEKYGDSLDMQDPLLQKILEKIKHHGLSSSTMNLHTTPNIQKQTAEITRKRLETQRKIDELSRLKQSKLTSIKTSQIERTQLKAHKDILNEEISEIKRLNDNMENLKERELYQRNNENLSIIKGALNPLSPLENFEKVNPNQIVFNYKTHPNIKVVLTLDTTIENENQNQNEDEIKVEGIVCQGLKEEMLISITKQANKAINSVERINKASELLYAAVLVYIR